MRSIVREVLQGGKGIRSRVFPQAGQYCWLPRMKEVTHTGHSSYLPACDMQNATLELSLLIQGCSMIGVHRLCHLVARIMGERERDRGDRTGYILVEQHS